MNDYNADPQPRRLSEDHYSLDVKVINEMGLHARPASLVVGIASKYPCEVTVRNGSKLVDAKSILQLLSLSAEMGTHLTLETRGDDALEAIRQLAELVENGFYDPPSDAPSTG
ncbi:HPr family phosphocarrier protein [bacterium]|nr:HPr family phosphocarrier protein [bacterium]